MTNSEPTTAAITMSNMDVAYLPTFSVDDDDCAIGWECANPALQIERWGQDEAAGARQ
ncbi:hypothetical protein [Caenimonas sp. SL110]|uniref:hypothetical protein n=1 Tax=Caenimonas sp. SL110 TaxID=1450524 RepID=UPI0013792542|nr:hypothetical protein [Caenimonas sp. SL110]